MTPPRGVGDVPPQQTRDRWGTEKGDVLTTVVAALKTGFAFVADDLGLNGDAVAGFERCDCGVDREDGTAGFVAEDVVG